MKDPRRTLSGSGSSIADGLRLDLQMKAIQNRLRRLENAVAPNESELALAAEILAARRRRLGTDYEPISIPPEIYSGCRGIADRIRRARQFLLEQRTNAMKAAR